MSLWFVINKMCHNSDTEVIHFFAYQYLAFAKQNCVTIIMFIAALGLYYIQ